MTNDVNLIGHDHVLDLLLIDVDCMRLTMLIMPSFQQFILIKIMFIFLYGMPVWDIFSRMLLNI